MYKTFSKITANLRYRLINKLIKIITPSLSNKLFLLGNTSNKLNFFNIVNNDTPRPSIILMKKYFNKKVIGVEIGVGKGINAISILHELDIEKLYLIDIWNEYNGGTKKINISENYKTVLNKFNKNKKVKIIRNFSIEGSKMFRPLTLDFAYIDADHTYEYIYNDLVSWFPKIKHGGILAGHDIFNDIEVLRAVKDWCMKNKIKFNIIIPDWYIIKE